MAMLTTAAGTTKAKRAVVAGAGVAGLHAANELLNDLADIRGPGRSRRPGSDHGLSAQNSLDVEEHNRLLFASIEGRDDVYQIPCYLAAYEEAKSVIIARTYGRPDLVGDTYPSSCVQKGDVHI